MQQLKMYKTDGARADETLPRGYTYATHDESYIDKWISVMDGAIGSEWTSEKFYKSMLDLPGLSPEGIFYVLNDNGEAVATAAGVCDHGGDIGTGQLHMVAVHISCRGMGLGAPISAKAANYLHASGMKKIMLTTDDFRLPAVKVYLNQGYIPVLYDESMLERWKEMAKQTGRTALPAYDGDVYIDNIFDIK